MKSGDLPNTVVIVPEEMIDGEAVLMCGRQRIGLIICQRDVNAAETAPVKLMVTLPIIGKLSQFRIKLTNDEGESDKVANVSSSSQNFERG